MSKKKKITLAVSVFFLLILFVWLFLFRKESTPKDFHQIAKRGVLYIVTDYNSVSYFVSGDTIAGFNYELIELLKSYIPFEIRVSLEANLEKSMDGISNGKYDVLARNMPVTTELKESLLFTEPIAQNRQVLIQRKKEYNDTIEPLRSHLELAKKTLFVPADSPAILRIRNLSHEIGDTIYIKEDEIYGAEQLAMLVASKEIDYAVCDERAAAKIAESLPEIDYKTLIGFTHFEAWAVSDKSPDLLDSLNVWIKKMKKTKAYDNIYRKYYR